MDNDLPRHALLDTYSAFSLRKDSSQSGSLFSPQILARSFAHHDYHTKSDLQLSPPSLPKYD